MATWRSWLKTLIFGDKDAQLSPEPAATPVAQTLPSSTNGAEATAPAPQATTPSAAPPPLSPQELPASFPLLPLKTWLSQNVSFYAWDRIILRCISALRKEGISLAEAMNPQPFSRVSRETLYALLTTLYELYQVRIPPAFFQQGAEIPTR